MKRSGIIGIIVVTGIALFYFFFNPSEYQWMPQCVFYRLTGFQCMGCGAQRMVHALMHGDIDEAFSANAFLLCSVPFLLALLFIEFKRESIPALYRKIHSRFNMILVAVLLLSWGVMRNYWGI